MPSKIYKTYFEKLPASARRKWKYNSEKLNEATFDEQVKTEKIGIILKEHFIELKDASGNIPDGYRSEDISCIGNKKDVSIRLVKIIDDENLIFDDLPEIAKKLTKKIYEFIETNNS